MAVLFDGFDNLAGKGLPNVKIEDIHLSVAQDPEPESNPHINSIREVVATGTSNNKLIQNASPSLAKKQLVNKDFYLDLTLSILNIESFGNSLVLNQVNYLDFVYVKVIQSLSKNLTNELFTKDFPVDYTNLTNVSDYTEKVFKLSDFYDNKSLYVENSQTKTKVYKHTKQVRFTSKNPLKDYLDVFAYAYVDMDELISKFELNIGSNYEIKGYVAKENVIADKKVNSESYILTDQNSNIFIGTPIKGPNGKFLKQKVSGNGLNNEPLNVVKITNKKITDTRNIEDLEKETAANIQTPNKNKKSQETVNKEFEFKTSYISELYASKQSNNTYSSFFVFDIVSFLKDNSTTPETYDNPKVYRYIKIKKLDLIRRRVKTIDSIVQNFSEYTPNKTIISTSENSFKNLTTKFSFYDQYNNLYTTSLQNLKSGNFGSELPTTTTFADLRKVAAISELDIPTAKTFRCFTFTDFELEKITAGEYRYEVNIEIEDQSIEYYKRIIAVLSSLNDKLNKYLSDAERTDMYSSTENRQTQKFINYQKRKYNNLNINTAINAGAINQKLTIQNAPWIEIPSTLISIERELSLNSKSSVNTTRRTQRYYTSLNPSSTSPTKIKYIIDTINQHISQIEQKYSLTDMSQNKNENNYNGGNKIKTLQISNIFSKVIDSDERKIGVDYLKPEEPKASNFTFGLPRLNKTRFQERTNNEIKKYFPSVSNLTLTNLTPSISVEDQASLGDIISYSTCYFSPSSIFYDYDSAEPVSLEVIDSSNLNLSTYDNIVNNALLSTGTKATTSLSNQVSSKTRVGLSAIKNIATNIASTIQLSFSKPDLMRVASDVFDNSGFNTIDRPYTIEEICKLSNPETKDETVLSTFSSLTNLLLDDVARPTATEDSTTTLVSINPLESFNIQSANNNFNAIKTYMRSRSANETSVATSIDVSSLTFAGTGSTTSEGVDLLALAGITTTSTIEGSALTYAGLATVPLQTKSLMLDSVIPTKFNLSSFGFDPFLHPSTKNFMRLNFQNICKTEYLFGFQKVKGKYDINKPVWKALTKKEFDSLTGNVVVRTKQYSNKLLNIGTETGIEQTILNEFSILELDAPQPTAQTQNRTLTLNTGSLLPNITLNVNNSNISTNMILNNLNINQTNSETDLQISKELIVLNTMELDSKASYTFSSLELNNGIK